MKINPLFPIKQEIDMKDVDELLNPSQPVFQANPDITFKKAFFLGEDFGKEIHAEIIKNYAGIEAITKVNYNKKDKLVKGSNDFYCVAVNEEFRKRNLKIRTATQADLERILRESLLELSGHYEDSGLVLRNKQEPNSYFANDLFSQFKTQGINLKENTAYVINLHNLSLRKDNSPPCKLSFNLPSLIANITDGYFEAPILNIASQQKFDSSDIEVKTGIPAKVSATGSRILYTRNFASYPIKSSGVSRLYLNGGLGLYSGSVNLPSSDDDGRVVCVSGEASAL